MHFKTPHGVPPENADVQFPFLRECRRQAAARVISFFRTCRPTPDQDFRAGISGQHPLQMLFIFASTFGSSARISASPGMDGPGVTVPSIRWPDAPLRAIPVVDAFPGDPVEFAVPKVLVPGAVGILTELPVPLGSLPELLMPPAFAGPFGTPLTAAVPAPAAPAFGEPTALPVPTLGPLAAPAAEVPPPEVPPADPLVCASAEVPVSASAVANAKTVAFMSVPLCIEPG